MDITAGLPRVEELFEARMPKGKAEISHIDGVVEIIESEDGSRRVKVTSREAFDVPLKLSAEHERLVAEGDAGRGRPAAGPPRADGDEPKRSGRPSAAS